MFADVVWLVIDWRREAAWVDVMAEMLLVERGMCEEKEESDEEVRGRESL
jgi:hypothetical protein